MELGMLIMPYYVKITFEINKEKLIRKFRYGKWIFIDKDIYPHYL